MTSPADHTQAPAAPAALEALERELDRVLPPGSEPRRSLAQPLEAVRAATHALADDPKAAPVLTAALDAFEDVLEALLRAAGWPTGALGRGEPVQ